MHLSHFAGFELFHLFRHVLTHELIALLLQPVLRYNGHVSDLLPLIQLVTAFVYVMCIICVQVRRVLPGTRPLSVILFSFLLVPHVSLEIETHVCLLTLVLLLELPYPLFQVMQVLELRPLEVRVSQLSKEGRRLEFVDFELPLRDGQQVRVRVGIIQLPIIKDDSVLSVQNLLKPDTTSG